MAFFPRKLIAAAMLAALSLPSLAQMPAPQPGAAPAPMVAPHHAVRKKANHVKRHSARHTAPIVRTAPIAVPIARHVKPISAYCDYTAGISMSAVFFLKGCLYGFPSP